MGKSEEDYSHTKVNEKAEGTRRILGRRDDEGRRKRPRNYEKLERRGIFVRTSFTPSLNHLLIFLLFPCLIIVPHTHTFRYHIFETLPLFHTSHSFSPPFYLTFIPLSDGSRFSLPHFLMYTHLRDHFYLLSALKWNPWSLFTSPTPFLKRFPILIYFFVPNSISPHFHSLSIVFDGSNIPTKPSTALSPTLAFISN